MVVSITHDKVPTN